MSLDRFKEAQQSPSVGFDAALAEIRAGHKRGHCIWYIFPQLHGLGHSPQSQRYGLTGYAEAGAYLSDALLSERLRRATAAVAEQLAQGNRLVSLMGSEIDALKLVSSLTLFESAAERVTDPAGKADLTQFCQNCAAILELAERQGYPRCARTLEAIR